MRKVEASAQRYIEEIKNIQEKGPYFLGGFSGGGMVALEMAHQLIDQGEEVPVVVLLEAYGPDYPMDPTYLMGVLYSVLNIFVRIRRVILDFFPWITGHTRIFVGLDWPGKVAYIRYKSQGRISQIWLKFRRIIGRALSFSAEKRDPDPEAKIETKDGYSTPRFTGRVVLFRAEDQPVDFNYDPLLGWGEILMGEFEVHEVPGLHDSILFGPRVAVLAEKLSNSLRGIQQSDDPSPRETR
jgi:hypothetical protein